MNTGQRVAHRDRYRGPCVPNARQIDSSIAWLLENGSPAVRYLTHYHLLGSDPGGETAAKLWRGVERSDVSREVFTKQRPDGSWCAGGTWARKPSYIPQGGYSPFTPKYVTTLWILLILGEMGFRVGDPRIDRACDYVLSHQLPNGLFLRFARPSDIPDWATESPPTNTPCELSMYLRALGSVGMAEDPRLAKSYDLLVNWQRDDGGWVLQRHLEERFKTRSCPDSTHNATVAVYQRGGPEYEPILVKALAFLIWHLSLKDERKLWKLRFRGHDILKEMLMFSHLGVGLTKRPVEAILGWLVSMYDAERGCFHYAGRKSAATDLGSAAAKYWLFQRIEDDWLTYHVTRIAVNLRDRSRLGGTTRKGETNERQTPC